MATITFTDVLANNPGLEDILDATPTIGTHNTTTFDVINNNVGATNGFVFAFSGTGFTYSGTTPTAGTITSIKIFDNAANVVADIAGPFGTTSLVTIWNTLQSSGAVAALDTLLLSANTFNGAGSADHLTTFGDLSVVNTLSGGAGDDVLWARANRGLLIGGADNDLFRLDLGGGLGFAVHGSASDGSGGASETDTVEIRALGVFFQSITNIDRMFFRDPGPPILKTVIITTDQVGPGLISPTLVVDGAAGTSSDRILVNRGSTGSSFDFSGWTFTNWTPDDQVTFSFQANPAAAQLIGTMVSDRMTFGIGNDTANGGAGNDDIDGGVGNDTLDGDAGTDTLLGQSGADTFVFDAGDAVPGEFITGSDFAGSDDGFVDKILVRGNVNFTNVDFVDIQRIEFNGAHTLTFNRSAGGLDWTVVGSAGVNTINVVLNGIGGISLDTWSFQSWAPGVDVFNLTGTPIDDVVFAPSVRSSLNGGGSTLDFLTIDRSSLTNGSVVNLTNPAVVQTLADGTTFVNFENVTLALGSGLDAVQGGAGLDNFFGGGGTDVLSSGASNGDHLFGEGGDDQLTSLGRAQTIDGGTGTDFALVDRSTQTASYDVDLGDSEIVSSIGDGTSIIRVERIEFRAGSGNDDATGGALADILIGNAGRDLLSGGGSKDTVDGGSGVDILDGGAGDDTITGGTGIDIIDGGDGSDTLDGGTEADTIDGGLGNDFVMGGNGADNLDGGGGDDNVMGGVGSDTLDGGAGNDQINGGLFNDSMAGGLGNDQFLVDHAFDRTNESAGEGTDQVLTTVSYTLGAGDSIETLATTNAAGTAAINLTGNELINAITGNAGANELNGGAGADVLTAGAGNDALDGGLANDTLNGGVGNDTYVIDSLSDVLQDSAGIDLVKSTVTKTLAAGYENLTLLGAAALNGTGNTVANVITGNAGNNRLMGLGGNDTFDGGDGDDVLTGGIGKDTMRGGTGDDDFDFNTIAEIGKGATRDVVRDLAVGDQIDLFTIDANGGAAGHTFAFLAAAGAAFTGVAGQLRWFKVDAAGTANDMTIVEGDTNGNKVADFQIQLTGLKNLTGDHLIL